MTYEEAQKALDELLETVGLTPDEAEYLIDWGVRAIGAMVEEDVQRFNSNQVLYNDTSLQSLMILVLSGYLAQRDHTLEKDMFSLIECGTWLAECVVDSLAKVGVKIEDVHRFTATKTQ